MGEMITASAFTEDEQRDACHRVRELAERERISGNAAAARIGEELGVSQGTIKRWASVHSISLAPRLVPGAEPTYRGATSDTGPANQHRRASAAELRANLREGIAEAAQLQLTVITSAIQQYASKRRPRQAPPDYSTALRNLAVTSGILQDKAQEDVSTGGTPSDAPTAEEQRDATANIVAMMRGANP